MRKVPSRLEKTFAHSRLAEVTNNALFYFKY